MAKRSSQHHGKNRATNTTKCPEEVFGKLYKKGKGNHKTPFWKGEDTSSGYKMYDYGDDLSSIDSSASMRNAMTRSNYEDYRMLQNDLVVRERNTLLAQLPCL